MPRRYIIDVPPEWLSKQLDESGRVRRIKRLAKPLTSTLGENDCRLVMAGRIGKTEDRDASPAAESNSQPRHARDA